MSMRLVEMCFLLVLLGGVAYAAVPTGLGTDAIPTIPDAAPAEPYACAPGVEGHIVYVDDSDDNLWSMVCYCANNDDGTGYAWLSFGDPGTPCIFV